MAENKASSSGYSCNNLPGSSNTQMEIDDNKSPPIYDSLGRLINGLNDHEIRPNNNQLAGRRSWTGYQTLPANFKQHHCHVSRRRTSVQNQRKYLLDNRPSRSLTSSPVRNRAARRDSVKETSEDPSKNGITSEGSSMNSLHDSQESISNIPPGSLGGCCGGGHRRSESCTAASFWEGLKRSHTDAPLAALRARFRRTVSEGDPDGERASGRDSPIRLIPSNRGSLTESPRRLVRLKIKCDHALYPHQVSHT